MQNEHHSPVTNDEIDIKDLFSTITRNKLFILICAVIFTVGAGIYAFIQPNIYSASTSLELQSSGNAGTSAEGALTAAISGQGSNYLDNEEYMLKSGYLAKRALKYLELGTRYYGHTRWQKNELYKSSPFVVRTFFMSESLYGKEIDLIPLNKTSFRLRIVPKQGFSIRTILRYLKLVPDRKNGVEYDGIHHYGEEVATSWFRIRIDPIANLSAQQYSFSYRPNSQMGWLVRSGVRTSRVSETGTILLLSKMDLVPQRAMDVVNALAKTFIELEVDRKTEQADLTLKFIDRQLEAMNKSLRSSQKELEDFKQTNTLVDISQKASMTTNQLAGYETELQKMDMERNILNNLRQYMMDNENPSGIVVGTTDVAGSGLTAMITELKSKALERQGLLVDYTELHPDVVKLSEVINQLRKSIMSSIDNTLTVLQARKKSFELLEQESKASLEALPVQEQQLANLTRMTVVNENIYSFLLQNRASTAILRSSTISKNNIIDPATFPGMPVQPHRKMIAMVGLLLGLMFGIFYAFVKEYFDDTIKRKDELDRLTNIPLYGMIPDVQGERFGGTFLEAFRSLRTNLEFMREDKDYKMIVVTSSVSGEGKTTVAANLSVVYAKSYKKVVVVDLDMRRAQLSEYFDMKNDKGISTLLSKKNTLDEVIQKTDKYVDIIAAGPTPPNPSELIMSDYAKQVMDELRERYDYIILDTPPVGLVTDAAILMNRADVSLLLVRYDYTKRDFVKGLDNLVRDHNLEHVGILFNGIDLTKRNNNYYGYGYGYGYGKTYGKKYGASRYYNE